MSTTMDLSLKVLYVQGLASDVDRATTEQLRDASSELQITTIAGSAAALAELRRTPGWQALFASPSLPQNEILALIASLRRDRVPIAIVPIVDDAHQDLFASAVASGADDVLVRRAGSLVNLNETLTRIRQSPHLFPAEQRRRISVLYAGRDALVWNLLDQIPFVKADRVATSIDGTCSVRRPGAGDDSLRTDAVIIDETPGDAHPLQVLKSVKAQASDLPVIMLTSAGATDIATAALELGADDTVLKTGIFRRRLIATLRRVHQRIELNAQQTETRTREERLRQIVENVPTGIMVVAADGRVLAMNAAALHLFGAAKPRDIVGRDFREMVETGHRDAVTDLIRKVTKGEAGSVTFDALTQGGGRLQAHIDAVVLERDARGGRGLVASITRPGQVSTDADAGAGDHGEELAGLRDTLERLERHYAELEDARTSERASWESERQRMETRLEAAERLAAERATIQERLDEVSAELARTSESFASERQSLQVRLQELEQATHEAAMAGAVHASLEGSLGAVREELRQAIEAHALERSGWQDIRSDLEGRVQQLDSAHRSEQDSLVAALQQDVRRLEEELTDQGARWNSTREELERELRNAREALWAEHSDRDAARAASEAELTALRTAFEQERAAWLEDRAATERELVQARDSATSHQNDWERTRSDFELAVHELRVALEAERVRVEADRATFEQSRQGLEATLENERWQRQQQLEAFEAERQSFVASGIAESDVNVERSRLEAELEELREQGNRDRHAAELALEQARQQTDRLDETLRVLAEELESTRRRLEQERDDTRLAAESNWRERVGALESQLHEATLRVEAAEHARQQATQDAATATAQRELDWSTAQTEWQQRLNALETALADAAGRSAQLESDWINERSGLHQIADAARAEAEQERGHLVSLHAREVEEWRQAVDRARGERDHATSRVSVIEAQRNDAQHRVAQIEQELADVRTHVSTLEALQPELDATRKERDDARQRIEALEQELAGTWQQLVALDALQPDLEAARRERDDAQQRIGVLEQDLVDARAHVSTLEALQPALDATRQERDDARQRIDALEQELAGTWQQLVALDALQPDLDAARRERDDAQQRIDVLEEELGAAHRQHIDALADLRMALDAAQREREELQTHTATLAQELDDARRDVIALSSLQPLLETAQREAEDRLRHIEQIERDRATARDGALAGQTAIDALEAARTEIRHTDAAHHAEREQWAMERQTLEHRLRDAETLRVVESDRWNMARKQFERDAREASHLADQLQQLHRTIDTLQQERASLALAVSEAQKSREHDRRELQELQSVLAQAEHRLADMDGTLERTARSADEQLANQRAQHEDRLQELDAEIHQLTARLNRSAHEAEVVRVDMAASLQQAAESHARLLESDAFGYAVTTRTGELVKCNDAFGRIFGYAGASDVLRRNAGRPFKGLSGRADFDTRLAAEARVERRMSCVDRVDGQAVRIVETAVILDPKHAAESLIEHVIVAGPAGPTADELKARRLQEVGALTTAMVPELESLTSSVHTLSLEGQQNAGRTAPAADHEDLRVISGQVATLVRQLAAFSRRQLRSSEPLDLSALVTTAQPMLSRLVGDYITFTTEPGTARAINAQRGDVEQLLTSLVTLGRDLLPAGGTIAVQVRHDDTTGLPGGIDGPGSLLAVHASGYGVQFPGPMTALELIAQRCGGTIRVNGERGWMVRLEVVFPRCGSLVRPGWDWLTD